MSAGEECVHDWQVIELHLTLDHAGQAHACTRCPAVTYTDVQEATRPVLEPPRP